MRWLCKMWRVSFFSSKRGNFCRAGGETVPRATGGVDSHRGVPDRAIVDCFVLERAHAEDTGRHQLCLLYTSDAADD